MRDHGYAPPMQSARRIGKQRGGIGAVAEAGRFVACALQTELDPYGQAPAQFFEQVQDGFAQAVRPGGDGQSRDIRMGGCIG